MQGCKYNFPAI